MAFSGRFLTRARCLTGESFDLGKLFLKVRLISSNVALEQCRNR